MILFLDDRAQQQSYFLINMPITGFVRYTINLQLSMPNNSYNSGLVIVFASTIIQFMGFLELTINAQFATVYPPASTCGMTYARLFPHHCMCSSCSAPTPGLKGAACGVMHSTALTQSMPSYMHTMYPPNLTIFWNELSSYHH